MFRAYREHTLLADVALAVILSSVLLKYAVAESEIMETLKGNRAAVYSALASLFGTMAGFTLASVALFLQLTEHAPMQRFRRSRHFPKLGTVFLSAVLLLSLTTVTCLICLIFDKDTNPRPWMASAAIVAASVGLASLRSVLLVTWSTVRQYTKSARDLAIAQAKRDEAVGT